MFDCVVAADGLFVTVKFEEATSSPLTIVLSAFNYLCQLLVEKNTVDERQRVFKMLQSEFGSNLYLLVRTLPSVLGLASSGTYVGSLIDDALNESEVNFFSLCDIIQRFMRIISSPSCPVLFLCDDLQWADSISLGLVHAFLSDTVGSSSVLFVGTYRDNEVSPEHIMFGFCDWLSRFNVPIATVRLDGMSVEHVNSMVSDSLGMLPRLCKSLAEVVHRKTKGNPFFVQTFLRSLVDKELLVHSLREKCWAWNLNEILAEEVTPNVLQLISTKLNNLSDGVQVRTSYLDMAGSHPINLSSVFYFKTTFNHLPDCAQSCILLWHQDSCIGYAGLIYCPP